MGAYAKRFEIEAVGITLEPSTFGWGLFQLWLSTILVSSGWPGAEDISCCELSNFQPFALRDSSGPDTLAATVLASTDKRLLACWLVCSTSYTVDAVVRPTLYYHKLIRDMFTQHCKFFTGQISIAIAVQITKTFRDIWLTGRNTNKFIRELRYST